MRQEVTPSGDLITRQDAIQADVAFSAALDEFGTVKKSKATLKLQRPKNEYEAVAERSNSTVAHGAGGGIAKYGFSQPPLLYS